MRLPQCLLTAACAVGFLGTAAAAPSQHFSANTRDAGATAASTLISTSIILNVTDPQGLENFVAQTTIPASPQYHRFLTVGQFTKRFAPSNHAIELLVRYFESFGLTVNKVYPDNLDITVTGTAAEINAALSTQLQDYTRNGQRFHRPAWKYVLPGELSSLVLAIPGLSNEPSGLHPHLVHLGRGAYSGAAPRAHAAAALRDARARIVDHEVIAPRRILDARAVLVGDLDARNDAEERHREWSPPGIHRGRCR